MGMLCSMQKEK